MDKKTLLLVEDESILALSAKMSLEKYNYAVIIVNSGEKAIQAVDSNPEIDLVLIDIDLGKGIDGTEAAGKILEKHDIPIVFLSSHTESEIVEKTEKITSYGYVVKNSSTTVLDASIKMAFKLFDSFREKNKKEEEIRKSEEDYRKLFEFHSAIKLLVDPKTGNIFDANYAAIDFYGWTRDEMRIMNIKQIHADAQQGIPDGFLTSMKTEQTHFELKHKKADGSICDVHVYVNKLVIVGNEYLDLIINDITDRKRAESALLESEERFRIFSNITSEGIMIYRDGVIIAANIAFAKIWGYQSVEDKIGKNSFDFLNVTLESLSAIQAHIKSCSSDIYEIVANRIDGTQFIGETQGKDIVYQGKPARVISMRDITERKKAEEETKKQLVEKEILQKEVHHRISSMRVLCEKLLISEDYTDVFVKTYLESLIDAIVALFPDTITVTIDKRIDEFSMSAKTLFSLGIILNELMTNILKYAFTGCDSGLIAVSLTRDRETTILTVHDNGRGLPEGFDLRASTGFGLMLVRMLSEQLKGTILAENDTGTKITLTFAV